MTPKQISLIIADDHQVVREGFATLVGKLPHINIIGEAANGRELVRGVSRLQPDVVITDIKMPVMDGIEATRLITESHPGIGIIALSMFDGDYLVAEMIEAGASGYLLKNASRAEMVKAIEEVSRRHSYYSAAIAGRLAAAVQTNRLSGDNPLASKTLSSREKQVIAMVCKGFYAWEIARDLNLGIRTVEKYKEALLLKTGCRNTAALVTYAMKHHIYEP